MLDIWMALRRRRAFICTGNCRAPRQIGPICAPFDLTLPNVSVHIGLSQRSRSETHDMSGFRSEIFLPELLLIVGRLVQVERPDLYEVNWG
jgi:hypothetical protein